MIQSRFNYNFRGVLLMAITVNQIAEKCGVSRTTVLRALNGHGRISTDTKKMILKVAQEHNYRPNLLARSLHKGRTMSLGVVTVNVDNLYFVQSLSAIDKEADRHGYFTNIVIGGDSLRSEQKLIQGLADRKVEGIILSPVNKGAEFVDFLHSLQIPVVCIGNYLADSITSIHVDELHATKEAVDLIVSKGYERIIFICPPLEWEKDHNVYVHNQRLQGVYEAQAVYSTLEVITLGSSNYLSQLELLLEKNQRRTTILCSGDSYALDVMKFCKSRGFDIPRDFGLMGFDDISVLDLITPKLTTVATNVEGVATAAVTELLAQIESVEYKAKKVYLDYKILDRETL